MAISMNKVILIGNVGNDPEVRQIPSGAKVCRLSVATSESYKDKASGEWKETTEWHSVTLWDFLAERAEKFIKKGSKVCIEGKNKTTSYEKEGVTHYRTEVQARDLIILDPKRDNDGSTSGYSSPATGNSPDLSSDSGDDDIPF